MRKLILPDIRMEMSQHMLYLRVRIQENDRMYKKRSTCSN
jgi:hypothetical protein